MASYEEVLHLLRYRNWHTRSLLDRKFKLVCSELNGRYVSNEFQVEVRASSAATECPSHSPNVCRHRCGEQSWCSCLGSSGVVAFSSLGAAAGQAYTWSRLGSSTGLHSHGLPQPKS